MGRNDQSQWISITNLTCRFEQDPQWPACVTVYSASSHSVLLSKFLKKFQPFPLFLAKHPPQPVLLVPRYRMHLIWPFHAANSVRIVVLRRVVRVVIGVVSHWPDILSKERMKSDANLYLSLTSGIGSSSSEGDPWVQNHCDRVSRSWPHKSARVLRMMSNDCFFRKFFPPARPAQ